MAISREDVLSYLEKSNMIEISELIKEIEEKFGVSAAAPMAVAAAPAAGEQAAEAKTEFEREHNIDKVNELKLYEFLTAKIAEIIDMHYDGEL